MLRDRLGRETALRALDCTTIGKGPWNTALNLRHRSIDVFNIRSGYTHRVYYGTRTKRSREDAQAQATALCAILNLLKAKRP